MADKESTVKVVPLFGSTGPLADRHHRHGSKPSLNGNFRSVSHSPPHSYGSTEYRGKLTSSPERIRRSNSCLNVVPEDRIIMEFSSTTDPRTPMYTGGVSFNDDDDDEWEIDAELEQQGLYRGSYYRLMLLYTLTPLTFAIAFALLAALPYAIYPMSESWPYPSVPYLRHPLPELLTSASLSTLSHLLREPLSVLITFLFPSSSQIVPTLLSTALHTLLYVVLQLSTLGLLLVTQHAPTRPTTEDAAFRRVWWIALGWACAEAVIGVSKGYQARALYRDVLVTVHLTEDAPGRVYGTESSRHLGLGIMGASRSGSRSPRGKDPVADHASTPGQSTLELFERQIEDEVYDGRRSHSHPFGDEGEVEAEHQPLLPKSNGAPTRGCQPEDSEEEAIKLLVEDELDELIAMRAREELEDAYGVPVVRIPIFIPPLHRLTSLLLTLGLTLLLAQAYLRSPLSFPSPPFPPPNSNSTSNLPLALAAPTVWIIQAYLALLHTPLVLPRIGMPGVVYQASVLSLGVFWGGLAVWKGLA